MAMPVEQQKPGEERSGTVVAFPPSPEPVAATLPSAPPLILARYQAGSVLSAKYRLDALLGEGGMGAVWRATNLALELPVAIKLIRADLDRDALRARLQLEARSVAKVGHPAIVRVYDVSETELGDPFIVMELLHGETLAQMLTQGRVSAVRAVQLLLPIIDACAVAHARGVVHRDLKPDNIFITHEDERIQPKILDFGVAKLTDPRDANHRLTEVGTVVGSPDYMSPEQARGREDVDYRTDIWSLCVVLYEAVTGAPPFSASNYNALLRAIVEDEPKSLTEQAAGDAQLWQIVKQGLAKDRAQRQRSMAELGRSLAAWLLSHGAHEDVSGAAVDSKWLGRSSDPLTLGEALSETIRPPSISAAVKVTHDSLPSANHVDSRAPFTATIRPNTSSRTRTLRAAGAAVALLAAGALTFTLSTKRSNAPEVTQAASPVPATPLTVEASKIAPTPSPAVSLPSPSVTADIPAAPSASSTLASDLPAPKITPATKPLPNAGKRLAAPVAAPHKAATAPARNAAQPKPGARDLDLISPY